jgi:hypothetical protein
MLIRLNSEKELRRYGAASLSQVGDGVAERVAPSIDRARIASGALECVREQLPGVRGVNASWAKRHPTYTDPLSGAVKRTVLLEDVTFTATFDFLVQASEPCLFYELCVVVLPRSALSGDARAHIIDFYAQELARALPKALCERSAVTLGFYRVKVVERVTKPLRCTEIRRNV